MNSTKLSTVQMQQVETFKKVTTTGVCTVIKRVFPSGMKIGIVVEVPKAARKADLKMCLQELKTMRVPQKAMAFVTDMSSSYVSKLLR